MKHSNNFNSEDIKQFITDQNKERILEFIKDRIFERYIYPVENVPIEFKNGFNMMANACLSIEAFMKILNPIKISESSNRTLTGKGLFIKFFKQFELFESFKILGAEFYNDVRCGILHNGETNGLWKINRKSDTPILHCYDINANKFIISLKETIILKLNSYLDLGFESAEWENLVLSVTRIINNHHRFYFAYGSNMNEQRLRQRIGDNFITIGRGYLERYELTFNKKSNQYPYNGVANIVQNKYKSVEGILYQFIGNEHDVLSSIMKLDRAEGANYNREMYKIKIDLRDNNGIFESMPQDQILAYIYICKNPSYMDSSLKPSAEYLNHLISGGNHLTIPYLNFLKSFQ
jgi:hypothetical protein